MGIELVQLIIAVVLMGMNLFYPTGMLFSFLLGMNLGFCFNKYIDTI